MINMACQYRYNSWEGDAPLFILVVGVYFIFILFLQTLDKGVACAEWSASTQADFLPREPNKDKLFSPLTAGWPICTLSQANVDLCLVAFGTISVMSPLYMAKVHFA